MKKTMKRSLALGALMAFVITGSAMAATDSHSKGDLSKGFILEEKLNHSGMYCHGIYEDKAVNTVVNDAVKYSFTLNKGEFDSNSGVRAVQIRNKDANITYKGTADFYVSTDIKGTGNNAAVALDVTGGKVSFENNASFSAVVKGEGGKSAYGVSVMGIESPAVIKFSGDFVKVDVTTDMARKDKGTYCESAGVYSYKGDMISSENTNWIINVTGNDKTEKASPIYGILNEIGKTDLKGKVVINVESNGVSVDNKDKLDEPGLAVGIKVIDGTYNTSLGSQSGDSQTILNNAEINVVNNAAGGKAIGMEAVNFIDNNNDKAELMVNGNLDLTVTADTARGVMSRDGKKVVLGSDNSDYINITAQSANKSEKNTINVGICAIAGGEVDVNTKNLNVTVKATGENSAYGISAQNNSTPADNKDKFATVNINADNIYVESTAEKEGNSSGLVTMSQGQMNVHGNLEVHADNAITTRGGSTLNINNADSDAKNTTKLYGDISFAYDQATSGTPVDATVNVNLSGSESVWEGNTKIKWNLDKGKYEDIKDKLDVNNCNVTLSDGAKWNATNVVDVGIGEKEGAQYVALNKLTLNDGVVNLDKLDKQKLEVQNLAGTGGTIGVDSLDKGQLSIGTKDDKTQLTVNGNGAIADQIAADNNKANDLANVVVSGDKTAANKITTDEGVIAGRFEADVVVGQDGTVTLDNVSQGKNSTNTAISEMGSIALMAWRQENNDMNKRLGELRNSKGEHGIWTRMTRGESEFKSVKNQYNAYQIGYDEKLSTDKSWTVGAALTYTDAQSSFAGGSGENTHKGFAVYGSKLNEDGSFIDLIAKYARLEHEFDAVGGIGKGEYDTNGYSVSAEYGKRFDKGNGFWVEPQVELTYGKVGSVNYATDKAMAYQDGMESLVGRVGFSLGKDIKDGNVYVRASYLYDFDGETEVTMMSKDGKASDTYEQDLGGGWFEVGVGTNINLSDATYVYFDVEKTYGGDVATPWQWNAGVRYSF